MVHSKLFEAVMEFMNFQSVSSEGPRLLVSIYDDSWRPGFWEVRQWTQRHEFTYDVGRNHTVIPLIPPPPPFSKLYAKSSIYRSHYNYMYNTFSPGNHNKWHKLDHIPYSESFFSSWRTFPLKIKRCLSAGTFWGAKYIILYMTNHWTLFYIKYMNSLRKKPPRITYESYTHTMSFCFEWNTALRWQTLWRLTTSFAMCPLKSFTEL